MIINELIEKKLLTKTHHAIYDYAFQTNMRDAPWHDWLDKPGYFECKREYITTIHDWIHNSTLNNVTGLDNFYHRDMIIGTTQTFDEAYMKYANKRLRVFRGEYAYHRRVVYDNLKLLDDEQGVYIKLEPNDWCIISLPFCGNGSTHQHMKKLLDDALENNVPVIIDCAWFGTCNNLDFDFTHPAITSVSFSISKGIGMGNMRSGIRYSNYNNRNMPIAQQNDHNHLVLISAQIGIHQMNKFPADFISIKYNDAYQHMCKELNLLPTNCLHVAMAPDETIWHQFTIDGLYRKVGVRQLVKEVHKGNIL